MTTSGSSNFAISRDDIIREALETIGFTAFGDGIDPNITESCARKLNLMVKAWIADGAHLWAMSQATMFFEVGTATYSLGPTGDHCTNTYVQTTLSTDEAASSTSIGLTAYAGMANGDNIGIVLDDGTLHWTTISGAPGATTTIAAGLPSAATAGNVVFTYTTKINRPQRIDTDAAYWRSPQAYDLPVTVCSRDEYAQLVNKNSRGKVVNIFYDPQLVNGNLSVWPTPDSASDVLRFWYERPLEDFDDGTDTPDFPIEWGSTLTLNLADALAVNPTFEVPLPTQARISKMAAAALEKATGYDKENTSVFFQPDTRW